MLFNTSTWSVTLFDKILANDWPFLPIWRLIWRQVDGGISSEQLGWRCMDTTWTQTTLIHRNRMEMRCLVTCLRPQPPWYMTKSLQALPVFWPSETSFGAELTVDSDVDRWDTGVQTSGQDPKPSLMSMQRIWNGWAPVKCLSNFYTRQNPHGCWTFLVNLMADLMPSWR